MGAAVARHADTAVLTSDNPRSEDPLAILATMLQGAASVPAHERGEVQVFEDRAAAIAAAVSRALLGDTVLVAGKGHEQGQDIAGVVRPFDDRQVLREAIQKTQGMVADRPLPRRDRSSRRRADTRHTGSVRRGHRSGRPGLP
ncbi:UDP-N-acetylmuramoyl-L-alanyl-D-glutamate--2,6-diaminopimelate ligase [Streptomyces alboniger]